MASVVGIGAALYDILMTVGEFPTEDTKLRAEETKFQCGGPCATGLVAMTKLGETAAYLGTVGDDMFGTSVKSELEKYHVDTSRVRTEHGVNGHSVVIINTTTTSRTCVWNRGDAAEPGPEDVTEEVLRGAKYLHVDGNHLDCAIAAARKAREMGILVSMDAGGAYPNIENLLPLVDVLIPSEEFAKKVTGCATAQEAAAELERRYHPQILVVTQGSKGGFIWENGQEVRYPVFPVKAIDSNGAGDTFHGAFVAAQLKGMTVVESCRFASATSALKCTRFGAQQGIPGYEEVLEFLNTHEGVICNG